MGENLKVQMDWSMKKMLGEKSLRAPFRIPFLLRVSASPGRKKEVTQRSTEEEAQRAQRRK
jgi:hypothetical protein